MPTNLPPAVNISALTIRMKEDLPWPMGMYSRLQSAWFPPLNNNLMHTYLYKLQTNCTRHFQSMHYSLNPYTCFLNRVLFQFIIQGKKSTWKNQIICLQSHLLSVKPKFNSNDFFSHSFLALGPDQYENEISTYEIFSEETIEIASKLKISYALEEHLHVDYLEFEMYFPMEKRSQMVVGL